MNIYEKEARVQFVARTRNRVPDIFQALYLLSIRIQATLSGLVINHKHRLRNSYVMNRSSGGNREADGTEELSKTIQTVITRALSDWKNVNTTFLR